MSFRLASVSNVELWNFRNSSISVRLCWWTSRKSNCCRHNSSRRIRRSSSAWAAWSSCCPIFAQYTAIIICLCSSSKVLICAFELFRSHRFPCSIDHFLSLGVFRKLAVSTVRVSRETKTNWLVDISFSRRFPCSIEHDRQRRLTDWLTRLLNRNNRLVLGVPRWAACRVSRHLCPGPMTELYVGEGTLRVAELAEGHEVGLITCEGDVRRRRRRYSPCSRRCAGFAWRSGCRAQSTARSAGEWKRKEEHRWRTGGSRRGERWTQGGDAHEWLWMMFMTRLRSWANEVHGDPTSKSARYVRAQCIMCTTQTSV